MRSTLTGMDRRRLRIWLTVFFFALSIPAGVLIQQAYSELKWETFHQHRVQAEEMAARIDEQLDKLIAREEERAFSDYSFLNIAGETNINFLQRSPLSRFPVDSDIPGIIGYFQVDNNGIFTTPLLPAGEQAGDYGISDDEARQRRALQNRLLTILDRNQLVQHRQKSFGRKQAPQGVKRDLVTHYQSEVGPGSVTGAGLPEVSASSYPKGLEESAASTAEEYEETSGQGIMADDVETPSEPPASVIVSQRAFDELKSSPSLSSPVKKKSEKRLGNISDLKLDNAYQARTDKDRQAEQRIVQRSMQKSGILEKRARKEISRLPVPQALNRSTLNAASAEPKKNEIRIRTFESEIDPFELKLLNSGHFVLYRKVWRDNQRTIQGLLIDQAAFIKGMIETAFSNTALSATSNLLVAWQGNIISRFQGRRDFGSYTNPLNGALLYQTSLTSPVNDLQLIFTVNRLPLGPGANIIHWSAGILAVLLVAVFLLAYRTGSRQIELVRQQQDFVSAVSHELKTPLTSIRMYGEILREGWASEDKKKVYYNYIYDESERLSRLINNVLQLARFSRHAIQTDIRNIRTSELLDLVKSRIGSTIENAGFELQIECSDFASRVELAVDTDHFMQIVINLVDNALKFSVNAEKKIIFLGCRLISDQSIHFIIRDYGPGIPKDQIKKIFTLFYRAENEMTRETVGTGIGLALVKQLVTSMSGEIDVANAAPGAEFIVKFHVVA